MNPGRPSGGFFFFSGMVLTETGPNPGDFGGLRRELGLEASGRNIQKGRWTSSVQYIPPVGRGFRILCS